MHTKQVCSGTVTAVMGTTQSDMYSSLQDYLGKDESEFFFGFIRPGPLMVVISIVVWSLSIMSELSSTLTIVLAVCRLPIGAGRPLVETGEDDALRLRRRCRSNSFISAARAAASWSCSLARLHLPGAHHGHCRPILQHGRARLHPRPGRAHLRGARAAARQNAVPPQGRLEPGLFPPCRETCVQCLVRQRPPRPTLVPKRHLRLWPGHVLHYEHVVVAAA